MTRPVAVTPQWIRASLLAAFVVAASAGIGPWRDALAGSVRPPDFSQDLAAAQLWRDGVMPYGPAFQSRHARVYGSAVGAAYPYLPHPPAAVALALPLVSRPLHTAALIWFAVSLLSLVVLAILLAELWTDEWLGRKSGPPMAVTWTLVGLLLLWPPVLYHLEKGQFTLILAVLLALAWRELQRARGVGAGCLVGLAAAIKVFPILLLGYLAVRSRRALIAALAAGLVATLVPLMAMGSGALAGFLGQSAANVRYWETWPSVTYGLHGALVRLFVGGPWATPLVVWPHVATWTLGLAVIGLLGWAASATHEASDSDAQGDAYATWLTLLVLLNPLSMPHNAVILAWPITWAARRLRDVPTAVPRAVWSAVLMLVSLPRQLLSGLVPLPASPLSGLFITGLPFWGTLLLLWLAAVVIPRSLVASRTDGRW